MTVEPGGSARRIELADAIGGALCLRTDRPVSDTEPTCLRAPGLASVPALSFPIRLLVAFRSIAWGAGRSPSLELLVPRSGPSPPLELAGLLGLENVLAPGVPLCLLELGLALL